MTTYTSAVEIGHLRKTYGNLVAVDDISLSVAEGEIFGILGSNGAGKTTAIECAIGLREPDVGTITLLGLDPHALAGIAGILVAGAALGTPAPANPAGFALAVVLSVAGLFPLGAGDHRGGPDHQRGQRRRPAGSDPDAVLRRPVVAARAHARRAP